MFLAIDQPGELYQQGTLDARIEAEIEGELLSGLEARLYDGVGAFSETQPKHSTILMTDVRLYLEDTFARRTLSPYQHLYFDEVIPDDIRVVDIKTALVDRGFRVKDVTLARPDGQLRHFIRAQRPEGPETMELWLFLQGKRYQTERQRRVPGGQTYTSTFESGELMVYIRGELAQDSRGLTHEMN